MTQPLSQLESGDGPAVVLLHAFPLDARMWDAQRQALSTDHRVIVPDLRGFGGSPLGVDAPSLDAMADDVAALLDRLDLDRVVLGGLSMGGYVTMAFLRRHRERVRAVVLADTKASADPDAAVANRRRIADAVEADLGPQVLLTDVLPALLGPTTVAERPDVADAVRASVASAPWPGVAWAQRAMATRPDSFDTLRATEVPTLVVVGDEDVLSPPADAQAMVDALPHGRLAVIERSGHLTALERPDAMTEALAAFLDTL